MKNVLFLLILLCIAVSSFAQSSYRYDKVIVIERGTDNFSFDNKTTRKKSGNICIRTDRVSIDYKKYKLKKQLSDNLYKTRGGTIEYVFCDNGLAALHVKKYNTHYYYSIKSDKNVVAATKM